MSTTTARLPLDRARLLAYLIVADLAPHCERIEIAGSVRRCSETIGDVELVAIPKTTRNRDLFGEEVGPVIDMLTEHLETLERRGTVRRRPDKNGRKGGIGRLTWRFGNDVPEVEIGVDIFRALPTTFGCVLALRTGPFQFSKRLVTQGAKGDVCPNDMEFRDGFVWRYDAAAHRRFVPTPEESDLFDALGLPYVPPEQRTAETFERERA